MQAALENLDEAAAQEQELAAEEDRAEDGRAAAKKLLAEESKASAGEGKHRPETVGLQRAGLAQRLNDLQAQRSNWKASLSS